MTSLGRVELLLFFLISSKSWSSFF